MAHVMLLLIFNIFYFYSSISQTLCAVPNMAVFCSSLFRALPAMLLGYFLNYFDIFPVALVITSITFASTFYTRRISIVKSLYFKILSASSLITFLSPEIALSFKTHVPFSLLQVLMSS
jgi:hypothetical protein